MEYSPVKADIDAEPIILEIAKDYLGIEQSDTSKDRILKMHIGATCQLIRNYINLCPNEAVPESLYYVWAEMTSKRYVSATTSVTKDESGNITVKGKVNSVTDGSQSVSYSYENSASSFAATESDKAILSGFAAQLSPYRKIRWNI